MSQQASAQELGKKAEKQLIGKFFLVKARGLKIDRIWGKDAQDVKDFLNQNRCYFDSVTALN